MKGRRTKPRRKRRDRNKEDKNRGNEKNKENDKNKEKGKETESDLAIQLPLPPDGLLLRDGDVLLPLHHPHLDV